jgi:Uma2 family endonuclease
MPPRLSHDPGGPPGEDFAMTTARKLMTAEELLRLPDDGMRHELIAGELRTMAPSGAEHGELTALSTTSLAGYVRANNLGRVFGAETGFVSRERALAAGRVRGYWPGAPNLAIGVISPNDRYTEVEEKVDTWLAHGTRLVVVVDPRRRAVTVRRPDGRTRHLTVADTLDGQDVVPGWTLPVRELFAPDDE